MKFHFSKATRKRTLHILGTFLLVVLFFVALGGLSQHERWHIESVRVTGNHAIPQDRILSVAEPLLEGRYYFTYDRSNSFLFPRVGIRKALLEAYPRLEYVRTFRIDNHTIGIDVRERKPFALYCGETYQGETSSAPCYFLDHKGFIFDEAPRFSGSVYREFYTALESVSEISPLRAILPLDGFTATTTFADMLDQPIGEAHRIAFLGRGEYRVVIRESSAYPILKNTEIRIDSSSSPERFIKNLTAALNVKFPDGGERELAQTPPRVLHYIDMRYGNKIFFGFAPDGE